MKTNALRSSDPSVLYESIAAHRLPLAGMRYSDQLLKKERRACLLMANLKRHLEKAGAPEVPWSQLMYPGLPCPLKAIEPMDSGAAPRYSELFKVKPGLGGDPRTVGVLVRAEEGWVCLPPPPSLTRPQHLKACQRFQELVRSSDYELYDHQQSPDGVWRSLAVRSNARGDLMLVVNLHSGSLRDDIEEDIHHSLVQFFTEGAGADLDVQSLYVNKIPHDDAFLESSPVLLWGRPFLPHRFMGLSLSYGPLSVLPERLDAEERLAACVERVGEVTGRSTVVEVGSPHSLTALALSAKARACVGLNVHRNATADALRNSPGPNVSFEHGVPAEVLSRVLSAQPPPDDLLALVHTHGHTLNHRLLHTLRASIADRVLLLHRASAASDTSDTEDALLSSVARILCSGQRHHRPLLPKLAFAVDCLPDSCELTVGVLLQRL